MNFGLFSLASMLLSSCVKVDAGSLVVLVRGNVLVVPILSVQKAHASIRPQTVGVRADSLPSYRYESIKITEKNTHFIREYD